MARALALILAVLVAGCNGASGPLPIYIGHVATLSGPNKDGGEEEVRAIRLADQEQVKAAGQEHLSPIFVRHTDTRGKLEAFEAEAVRLVTVSRVSALLGGHSAEEVARLDKAQVPLVTAGLPMRGLSDLVFFTGLSPAIKGRVLARFARHHLKVAKIVVIADESREDALALAEAFSHEFMKSSDKSDVKPAAHAVTWRHGKDIPTDWAKRLGEVKSQAVLAVGAAPDLPRVRDALKFTGPMLFGGDDGEPFVDARDAEGVFFVTAFVRELDVPRAKEFSSRYRRAFSANPDVHAALAYDGARLLFEAIKQCPPPLSSEGIVKELAKLKDFPGLTGPLSFGEDRQLRRPAFVVQVEKGVLKTIKRFAPD